MLCNAKLLGMSTQARCMRTAASATTICAMAPSADWQEIHRRIRGSARDSHDLDLALARVLRAGAHIYSVNAALLRLACTGSLAAGGGGGVEGRDIPHVACHASDVAEARWEVGPANARASGSLPIEPTLTVWRTVLYSCSFCPGFKEVQIRGAEPTTAPHSMRLHTIPIRAHGVC